MKNLQVQLARQPEGVPAETDFALAHVDMPAPREGEVLVRNVHLSLDPYIRGAIAGRHMGHRKLEPGEVIYGRCVAEVVDSRHPGYAAGAYVVLESGWQEYALFKGGAPGVRKIPAHDAPLSAFLGVLGMPGLTAWAGVEKLANPALGSTFVVSAATGPVGGTAGQLAKAKGCRVVGIAGSDEKCRIVVETYGFDACVNYKAPDWTAALKAACPDGVDTYFDNVGGPMLDAVTAQLNLYGKIVLCGLVAQYNRATDGAVNGHNMGPFIGRRAQLLGLVVYDYEDRFAEFHKAAMPLLASGRLKTHEDRAVGLERAPAHFVKLMQGANAGKALVVVGPEKS